MSEGRLQATLPSFGANPAKTPAATGIQALIRNRWFRVLLVILAGVAAHGGCLRSVFYMDDLIQIQDSESVEGGRWWAQPSLILTNLSYYVTWRLAGFSPVAFHLGNLALHLLTALSIYWLARYLLAIEPQSQPAQWETLAWLAALVFAVHPLNTEVTHYARARDHGMVGLFSFLAAGWMALAMRRHWLWGMAALLAVLCAAVSKGPGLPHALLSVGLVLVAFSTRERWRALLPSRRVKRTVIFSAAVALLLVSGQIWKLAVSLAGLVTDEDFGPYALTQCRVLPQYLWRMVLPLHLCSDHLIESTKNLSDGWAWVCAAGVLGLTAAVIISWIHGGRRWALICALGLGALLLRWLYVVSEMMVEYRTYPAMPYAALLIAALLCCLWQRLPRFGTVAVCAVLTLFGFLAHRRSDDWSSRETLFAQILHLYPLQLRAMNGISQEDLRRERYEAILERYPDFMGRLQTAMTFTQNDPHRGFQTWPLWFVFEECAVAEAIAHTRGAASGMEYHNLTAWKLNELGIDSEGWFWGEWQFTAGKIAMLAGDSKSALREFVAARPNFRSPLAVDREIRKLSGGQPK